MNGRRLAAAAVVLVAVAAVPMLGRLEVDNRLERFVASSAEEQATYERFRETFGSDEFVLAIVSGGELFSYDALDPMLEALETLEAVDGVHQVRGLPTVFRDLFGGEDSDALADEMLSTPFYRGVFVNEAGTEAGLLITVVPGDGPRERGRLVDEIRAALEPVRSAGFEVRLVGSPVLAHALDATSSREAQRTLPVALAGTLLVLAVVLRSPRAMLVVAVVAVASVVVAMALVALSGRSLNMVTTALPPLVWVLALSNATHLVRRYQALRASRSSADAVRASYAGTWRSCTLAAVTTAVGFASLLAAPLEPVRELGAFAALGILFALVVTLVVVPVLLELLRVPGRPVTTGSWPERLVVRPRPVVIVGVAVAVAAAAAAPWIPVEANPLQFLPEGHPTVTAYLEAAEGVGGFYTLEVVLDLPEPYWHDEAASTVDGLAERIERSEVVARVLRPTDLVRKLNQWEHDLEPSAYRWPEGEGPSARDLLDGLDAVGAQALAELATEDGRRVRLSAVVETMNEHRLMDLASLARRAIADLPNGYSGAVTGQVLQLVQAQHQLVRTQLVSLAAAVGLVFGVLWLGLNSWRLTATALLPNVLPVLAVLAAMAVTRTPLNAATAMVASIALGIAVDNTAHVLEHVRRYRAGGATAASAAAEAVGAVAPAMIATTVSVAIGFFALALSAFIPIRAFGLLAAWAMLVAVVADLVLLPALIAVAKPRSNGGG